MVVVDADHPDIETYIDWKVKEEQKVAALVTGSKINAKALLVYCDSTGSGDAIYSLQCLRRLVERMESPN